VRAVRTRMLVTHLDSTVSSIRTELDALIAHGPLSVAYQPIVNLETGGVFGFEVLGRGGPSRGALADLLDRPAALLDLAHACGRLGALDARWRDLALDELSRAKPHAHVFLNLDPRAIGDDAATPERLLAAVTAAGLAPSRVVLELAEAAATRSFERAFEHYAEHGFRVAIDDLGAGERALTMLMRLRPQFIKLDGTLIEELDKDPLRKELVRAITTFATRTGSRVIAECVETPAELTAVREAGVHFAQGFLLGRPGPLPAVMQRRATASVSPGTSHDVVPQLVATLQRLDACPHFDDVLQEVVGCARDLLGVERVSIRLLDESRARLLVAARTGSSVHRDDHAEFQFGEGLVGWVVQHARGLRISNAEADVRFAIRGDQAVPVVSFLGVPLVDADGCIGVLSASSPALDRFSEQDEERLRLVAGIVMPHLQNGRLRRLSRTDPLTRVLNRSALDDILPDPAKAEPVTVALVDLDDFKLVNDRYGHVMGDRLLVAVAETLVGSVREADRVVRLGGDEFLLVLPGIDDVTAAPIAERACARIRAIKIAEQGVTASFGVATRGAPETRAELIARADVAMYRAKSTGRDRVVIDDDL